MLVVHCSLGAALLLLLSVLTAHAQTYESSDQWWKLARTELADALNVRDNWNVAKNVILFVGDGNGVTASTAARIYKGQKKGMHGEEGYLVWERFPNSALIKTYNVDRQVPDSAATATAMMCGVKVNYETVGLDSMVPFDDCEASKNPSAHLSSVLQWAQEAGKSTGVVTNTRITHATPAATYAHVANRRWECNVPEGKPGHGCPDIAVQLVTHNPGKNIKVILGGGRQNLGAALGIPDVLSCNRTDNRDLTKEWVDARRASGHRARYITSAAELRSVDHENVDYLLGLFADSHMPFVADQPSSSSNTPSLEEMATAAVRSLRKDSDGFFLLVEGGRIDHGLHNNEPRRALEETLAFDSAIAAVLKEVDLDDTLVVVTADHSHVLTINGYPRRGNDILGIADVSDVDGLPYATLMFTNGPGFNITSSKDGNVTRADPSMNPLSTVGAKSQTAVPMKEFRETHGGEDVALYAAGPMSHLFHRLHEQNYIAHVMAYAACLGPSAGSNCRRPSVSNLKHEETFSLPPSLYTGGTTGFLLSDNEMEVSKFVNSAAEAIRVASSAGIDTGEMESSSASAAAGDAVTHSSDPVLSSSSATSSISSSFSSSTSSTSSSSSSSSSSSLASLGFAEAPTFPSLSPTLKILLDANQQKLINTLGIEPIKTSLSFSSVEDVRKLLGKPAFSLGPPSHML